MRFAIGAAFLAVVWVFLPSPVSAQALPEPVPFALTEASPAFGPVGPFTVASMSVDVSGGISVGYSSVYSALTISEECAVITRVVLAGEPSFIGCAGDVQEGPDVPLGFVCSGSCSVRYSSSSPFALGAFRPPSEFGGADFSGVVQDLVATAPPTTTTTTTTIPTAPPVQSVELDGLGADGLAWVARFLLFGLGMALGR